MAIKSEQKVWKPRRSKKNGVFQIDLKGMPQKTLVTFLVEGAKTRNRPQLLYAAGLCIILPTMDTTITNFPLWCKSKTGGASIWDFQERLWTVDDPLARPDSRITSGSVIIGTLTFKERTAREKESAWKSIRLIFQGGEREYYLSSDRILDAMSVSLRLMGINDS